MRCSTDLRQRVLGFVAGGGSKADAARRFQAGIAGVYRWLGAADGLAAYRRPGPRGPRRIDWAALRAQVQAHPDWTLPERARHLGASRNGVSIANATPASAKPTPTGATGRGGEGKSRSTWMKADSNRPPAAATGMRQGGGVSRA